MATYSDILARLKTLMQAVDPSPSPAAVYVWSYPDDYAQMTDVLTSNDLVSLPAIVIARDSSEPTTVSNYTLTTIAHDPVFEILVFLEPGPLQKAEQVVSATELEPNWIPAISTALRDDQALNGAAIMMGDGSNNLFTYQSGHIHFAEPKIFWGIRFEIIVNQELV